MNLSTLVHIVTALATSSDKVRLVCTCCSELCSGVPLLHTGVQMIQGIEIPTSELRQDVLDPQVAICVSDVTLAPGNQDDDIQRQVGIG